MGKKRLAVAVGGATALLVGALGFNSPLADAKDSNKRLAFVGVPDQRFWNFGELEGSIDVGDEFSFVEDLYAVGPGNRPTGAKLGRLFVACQVMVTEPGGVEATCESAFMIDGKGDLYSSIALAFGESAHGVVGGVDSGTGRYFGVSGEEKATELSDQNNNGFTNTLHEFRLTDRAGR
jgi:hypothetical protein